MLKQRRSLITVAAILLLGTPLILATAFATDERIWSLIGNTFRLVLLTCAIAVPLGTFLAIVVVRTDVFGRKVIALLLAGMLFVPLYLQAAGWGAGFGRMGWLRLSDGSMLLEGMAGAAWIHGMASVAWVALIVGIGLRLVPRELEEEVSLNGSNFQVFMHVTLPSIAVSVVAAVLWVAVTTAGEMTVTDLYGVQTYAEELYVSSQLDLQQARTDALASSMATAWVVFVALFFFANILPANRDGGLQPPRVFELGKWKVPLALAACFSIGLVVGLPLANLVYQAGDELVDMGSSKEHRWSFLAFCQTLTRTPSRFAGDFGWTFSIAAIAATVALALALPLAWLARRGNLRAVPAFLVAAVCLALPGPLIGIELMRILNQPDIPWLFELYDRSILPPAAAMVIRSLPLAILVSWFALRSVSDDELDSAATEGAGAWTRFWRIAAAQRIGALAAAWLISFAISIGDLAATKWVTPPGVDLLSLRVFSMLHVGVTREAAGICLFNVFTFLAVATLALCLLKKSARAQ
ncbi:MAG: iron ABC transporter permease [Planctomycetes bacterium]|nr:iron ABC transporter permease [Planctomycetota bacterium]